MPGMLGAVGVTRAARAAFDSGVSRASGQEPREGHQGTGWVGRLLTGLRVPGACRGGHPRARWSLHLLGKDVSQPMAGPGAPSRPPPSGASPAGLSRRPPYAGARARPHRLPGTCRVPLRSAPRRRLDRCTRRSPPTTAAASGSAGPAWSGAGSGRRRDPSGGSGVGAASNRARARRRRRRLGARARGGGGAHVRVFVSEPDRRPRASWSSPGGSRGRDLGTEAVRRGFWPLAPLLLPLPSGILFTIPHPSTYRNRAQGN